MDYEEDFDTLMWRSGLGGTRTVEDRQQAVRAIHDAASPPREGTWMLPWDARDDATALGEQAAHTICGQQLVWVQPRGAGLEWRTADLEYVLERQGAWWAIRACRLDP